MITSLRNFILSFFTTLVYKTSPKQRYLLVTLLTIFVISLLGILLALRAKILVQVPAYGGVYRDAVVGIPRFINPVLASTDADQTLVKLVYSGLMRETSPGVFIPDLAESYTLSPDGHVYTFILKDNLKFHDGKPVTAHDIIYTITKIQNNITPLTAGWQSVDIASIDEKTVTITLKQKYSDFLRMATIGILPSHLWEPLSDEAFSASEFNTLPVGSGPYQVTDVSFGKSGVAQSYTLKRFKKFALGKPYLRTIILYTVSHNEDLFDLLKKGKLDGTLIHGISENIHNIKDISHYKKQPVPGAKVFGLFMNRSNTPLSDSVVRNYIAAILENDTEIIKSLGGDYAYQPTGPIPHRADIAYTPHALIPLEKNGFTKNQQTGIYEKTSTKTPISITLTTLDNP